MFGFERHEENHQYVYGQQEHEGKFSHELIAGAASFEAARLFEDRQRREGKPVTHAFAKEALAAFTGAEVDKLFESKGLDYLDRERVHNQAQDLSQQGYDNHYGQQQQWTPDFNPSARY